MKTIVIGAGPAGLTTAYKLSQKPEKTEVLLLEAGQSPGGMNKSFELWGQRVDLGPHRFFSTDPRVNALWLEAVGKEYEIVERTTRIFYGGKLFKYPLSPLDALSKLGFSDSVLSVAGWMKQRAAPKKEVASFEDWVVDAFGRHLFGIFFKAYSEKLWGIPCTELDLDFAAQRIKGLSVSSLIASLFSRSDRPKTLSDRFAYPKTGAGYPYERMAEKITAAGGKIRYGESVREILTDGGSRVTGVRLASGETLEADHIISSMPLNLLAKGLPGCPADVLEAAGKLKFRNTILVYLKLQGADLFPDNWIYIHLPELKTGRITNFNNWGGEKKPESILVMEYWCNETDEIWRRDDQKLIELAKKELALSGLTAHAPVLDGAVRRIPKCYPVYEIGYKKHVEPIAAYIRGFENLQAIGRYGSFKYNNQDHSILMGLLAAENILEGRKHDLWTINTDYEYYEKSAIGKNGLEFLNA